MISHTRQEWFELAVRGLARQGWERSSRNAHCAYRGADGRRCAIGHGIPDAAYSPMFDDEIWSAGKLINHDVIGAEGDDASVFLQALQLTHDKSEGPTPMRSAFLAFASTHNLTWPADVAREGEIK